MIAAFFILIAQALTLADPSFLHTTSSSAQASPTPDILWWKFNEGSGTNFTDSSTVGTNVGYTTTGVTWTNSVAGGFAVALDGTTQLIRSVNQIVYATNTITVCFWLKNHNTSGVRILTEDGLNFAAAGDPNRYLLDIESGNYKAGMWWGGYTVKQVAIPATNLIHVSTVLLSTNTPADFKVFFDSVPKTLSSVIAGQTNNGTIDPDNLYIGARGAGPTFFFAGQIDDLRIYSGDQSAYVTNIYNDPQ